VRAWIAFLLCLTLCADAVVADDVSATASLIPGVCGTVAAPCQPHITAARAWALTSYPYLLPPGNRTDIGVFDATNTGAGYCAVQYGAAAPAAFFGTYRSGTRFDTAATANSFAGCTPNATSNVNSAQRPTVIFNTWINAAGGVNQRVWLTLRPPGNPTDTSLMILGGAGVPATTSTFVGALFDFSYSLNIQICSGDGAAGSCLDTGIQYAANTNYRVILDLSVPLTMTATISSTTSTAPDAWTTPASFAKSTNLPPDGVVLSVGTTITALENLVHSLYINTVELRWNP
jgi:hypothetical protein